MSSDESSQVIKFPGVHKSKPVVRQAVQRSLRRVAPVWPLDGFVAVNPFLGIAEEGFSVAARRISLACEARMYMSPEFYANALASQRVKAEDVDEAIHIVGDCAGIQVEHLADELAKGGAIKVQALPTVASVARELADTDWPSHVVERISYWASGYFDAGQAAWPSPFRELSPFKAWLAEMRIDCSDVVLGIDAAQEILADLPEDATEACEWCLNRLSIPDDLVELYLHRLQMTIGGWVAFARFRSWQRELAGSEPELIVDMLAIRLSWELLVLRGEVVQGIELSWRRSITGCDADSLLSRPASRAERALEIAQTAYEFAWQRELVSQLQAAPESSAAERPQVQAIFCIDVGSEVLMRALEQVSETTETLGFAGFFGLPKEHTPLANKQGSAHCPLLPTPAVRVRETVNGHTEELSSRLLRRVKLARQLERGWRAFKNSAVSSFIFVGSFGLVNGFRFAAHSPRSSRPEPNPRFYGLLPWVASDLGSQVRAVDGSSESLGLSCQVDFAENMLASMSLKSHFARIVMLTGYVSSGTNNAHASGTDCEAFGGQSDEASTRLAVTILNDQQVRAALVSRGYCVPEDTVFLAALHNTTTDALELFDTDSLPVTHRSDLQTLRTNLDRAGALARADRSAAQMLDPERATLSEMLRRANDWSQVRPEGGLAGCAGFVAAPRSMTSKLDPRGRCFLHSYDHTQDTEFKTLELIITAPMIVASWISLQYYASTIDNRVFGSGNKILHNVVGGGIGVFEGQGGDLRVGLPLQSVDNGDGPVHEPLRLSVFLAAPITAINQVLEKHQHVRDLVDNGWLHLFAIYDGGKVIVRYRGELQWDAFSSASVQNSQMHQH
ncbi:MAG: DUF2309 domain-containing protein [Pseudomonadota bacterium]